MEIREFADYLEKLCKEMKELNKGFDALCGECEDLSDRSKHLSEKEMTDECRIKHEVNKRVDRIWGKQKSRFRSIACGNSFLLWCLIFSVALNVIGVMVLIVLYKI